MGWTPSLPAPGSVPKPLLASAYSFLFKHSRFRKVHVLMKHILVRSWGHVK